MCLPFEKDIIIYIQERVTLKTAPFQCMEQGGKILQLRRSLQGNSRKMSFLGQS